MIQLSKRYRTPARWCEVCEFTSYTIHSITYSYMFMYSQTQLKHFTLFVWCLKTYDVHL